MPSVRIYQKKQIRLDRLSFPQTQMFKVGNIGVAAVKNRLAAAQGPTDSSAKALTKRYAIWKTKIGKGNRRNLMLTGDMLRNFQVRTVSENKAKASTSTRKDRIKAWITSKIEPWITFSPKNRTAVLVAMNRVLQESKARLVVEKALGGNARGSSEVAEQEHVRRPRGGSELRTARQGTARTPVATDRPRP